MGDTTRKAWHEELKKLFKSKPKAVKPTPKAPPAFPGWGEAKSVGPVAPVLKKAEAAAKGTTDQSNRYQRAGSK